VFKRRTPRSWLRLAAETVWPQSGWRRAGTYVWHRLRRLPDSPQRIARGVFAGVFVSFLPLYGIHMASAAAVALVIRGNVLAAIFATLVGNPLTFPPIAWLALETGHWLLGGDNAAPMSAVLDAFGSAAAQFWANLRALVFGGATQWDSLRVFYRQVYLPYMLGGTPTGLLAGLVSYYLSLPLIVGYQKLRATKARERVERRLAARAAALAAAEAAARAEAEAAARAGAGGTAAAGDATPRAAGVLPAAGPETPSRAGAGHG
jgi:uncharacterized protein (DUF2062 family)